MNFNEYQQLAERTAQNTVDNTVNRRLANFGMGIAGESGEVCDYLKKVVFHGHKLDEYKLQEELGDVLWYIATLATTAGLSLEGIANCNIRKLKTRYPEGFAIDKSINRE